MAAPPPLGSVRVGDALHLDVMVRDVDLLTAGCGLIIPLPHHILCNAKKLLINNQTEKCTAALKEDYNY